MCPGHTDWKFTVMLPVQVHPRHFNCKSSIHLSMVVMFYSSPTPGCMHIYMMYFYSQLLYLGSEILPQFIIPDGFTSALPIGIFPLV